MSAAATGQGPPFNEEPLDDEPRPDEWFAARLDLLARVNADRALAPAARHALIELLLDGIDDPGAPEGDRHLGPSARLAARLGLTPRGVRKALAELVGLGLIETSRGDVRVAPATVAERLCRGTDLPRSETEGADPIRAHAGRLEALRDQALSTGLVSTALVAERALGRALGYYIRPRRKFDLDEPDYAAMPVHERKGVYFDMVVPMLRDSFLLDPAHQDDILAFIAEVRAAAGGATDTSCFEARSSRSAPQDEVSDVEARSSSLGSSPHPEEAIRDGRLEGRGRGHPGLHPA